MRGLKYNYNMLPKTILVRLIDKYGQRIRFQMKCPVPETVTIPERDGTVVSYERRFALIQCGENPTITEVFFYEDGRVASLEKP